MGCAHSVTGVGWAESLHSGRVLHGQDPMTRAEDLRCNMIEQVWKHVLLSRIGF
jgi:hypothetical protein